MRSTVNNQFLDDSAPASIGTNGAGIRVTAGDLALVDPRGKRGTAGGLSHDSIPVSGADGDVLVSMEDHCRHEDSVLPRC
jgi:hypothetical protein